MFLKIVILTIILFTSLGISADELIVVSQINNFTLQYNENDISLKGHSLNLNLSKTECNKSLLKKFNSKMSKLLGAKALIKDKSPNSFYYKLNGSIYYENYRSKVGHNILSIPKELQRIKIEEKYKCNASANSSTKSR